MNRINLILRVIEKAEMIKKKLLVTFALNITKLTITGNYI